MRGNKEIEGNKIIENKVEIKENKGKEEKANNERSK